MSEETTPQYSAIQKEDFFKSFLADKPYEQTESLLNDKFVVKFRTLSVQESADVFNQLKKDTLSQKLNSDANYALFLVNYRLALSIAEINNEAFQPSITKDKVKDTETSSYVSERAKLLESWQAFKLSAIAEAFRVFETTVSDLTKEVQQPGFWKAAA